jgi:hypothetical protein
LAVDDADRSSFGIQNDNPLYSSRDHDANGLNERRFLCDGEHLGLHQISSSGRTRSAKRGRYSAVGLLKGYPTGEDTQQSWPQWRIGVGEEVAVGDHTQRFAILVDHYYPTQRGVQDLLQHNFRERGARYGGHL